METNSNEALPKPDKYYDGRRGLTKDAATTKRIATAGGHGLVRSGKRYSMDRKRALELVVIRRERKREREAIAAESSLITSQVKETIIEEGEPEY